ncbi:chitobiase/beta-hexosaminidase C-terminal domain-containing protein, partial [Prevotella sp.]
FQTYKTICLIPLIYRMSPTDPNAVAAPTFEAVTPFVGKGLVTIKGVEGSVVYYTTDGSVPTTSSLNNGTSSVNVEVTETTTIKAIAVNNGKESVNGF